MCLQPVSFIWESAVDYNYLMQISSMLWVTSAISSSHVRRDFHTLFIVLLSNHCGLLSMNKQQVIKPSHLYAVGIYPFRLGKLLMKIFKYVSTLNIYKFTRWEKETHTFWGISYAMGSLRLPNPTLWSISRKTYNSQFLVDFLLKLLPFAV